MKKTLLLTLFFLSIIHITFSQTISKPPHYFCQKIDAKDIIIDGKIEESAWEKADWSEDFIDIQGSQLPKPFLQTKMKMLWSDSSLYIAAYLQENHVWAAIDKDEEIMYFDNDFEIFIDVNRDHHHYVEFEFNALNKKWDLYLDRPYRDSVIPDVDWNCKGLKHQAYTYGSLNNPFGAEDSAWTIEVEIPLNQLSSSLKENDIWNINFSRVHWEIHIEDGKYIKKLKPENNWVWSPTWAINIHRPEYWGQLYFVENENTETLLMSDKEWNTRLQLMQAYDFQRNHWSRKKQYAQDWPHKEKGVEMHYNGFRCIYQKELEGQIYKVNEKGRIWKETFKMTPKFWVWMSGHAIKSDEEWEQVFKELEALGIRGILLSASAEQVKHIIPIAQQYQIQIHIWMWAMNRGDAPEELLSVNDLGKSLAEEKAYVGYYKFMCPALPETKSFIEKKVEELERIEGIDGIHLDYIRYVDVFLPSGLLPKYNLIQDDILAAFDYGYHPYLMHKFEEKFGMNPKSIPDYPHDSTWQQFRMDQVTNIVNSLSNQFSSKEINLSAAVFPDPKMSRRMVRQDWGKWKLDYYFPMVYNGFYQEGTAWIEKRMEITRDYLPESTVFCGLYLGDSPDFNGLAKSIDAAFNGGATGISFFDYWALKEHHKKAIKQAAKKHGIWLE